MAWTSSIVAIADLNTVEDFSREAPHGRVFRVDVVPVESLVR